MFMIRKYYTGISKLKIFSSLPMAISKLVISGLLEFSNIHMIVLIQPSALHTTYLLRFAKKNPIIRNQIYGV
jgi:hypothetical protein